MILDTKIAITGNSRNIKYYTCLGYNIKSGEKIEVDIKDLSNGSSFLINCRCDICGADKKIRYGVLFKYLKGDLLSKYYCVKCCKIKRFETNMERYGGKSPTCNKEIYDKIKKTNLEKWGTTCTLHSDKKKDVIKQIFIDKYGVDSPLKSKDIQNKCKKTLMENWGVNSPLQNKEIYNKLTQTNIERYGVENVFQNEFIKNNIIYKQFQDHGMYYTQTDEMKNKSVKTNIEKYGIYNYSKSIEYFNNVLQSKIKSNTDLEILDYLPNIKKYKIKCQKCNTNFLLSSDLIYHRLKSKLNICTNCLPIGKVYVSGSENEIFEILYSYFPDIEQTNRTFIKPYHLDMVIKSKMIAIEFNGLYWHCDKFKDENYHINKYINCNKAGLNLIQIWEDDWKLKPEIIISILKYKLKLCDYKIYARKCIVKNVTVIEKNKFLKENNLHDSCISSINLGLYNNNVLISLMCLNKINNEYELVRFCNKLNTCVVGSASKLFSHFIRNNKVYKVISFSDNSIFNGNFYNTLGFKFDSLSINCYWSDSKVRFLKEKKDKKMNKIYGAGIKKWIFEQ